MVLNYIVANKLIFMLDYLFVIPLSATGFIATTITLAGIFLALTIYNYLKYGDRNNTEEYISKYEACRYLNISRSTFDAYVKDGKLPKGKKRIGFKELAWTKKELDKYVHKLKSNNN